MSYNFSDKEIFSTHCLRAKYRGFVCDCLSVTFDAFNNVHYDTFILQTIIECLRYMTTGDKPPGSKTGDTFVHDPKASELNYLQKSLQNFEELVLKLIYIFG